MSDTLVKLTGDATRLHAAIERAQQHIRRLYPRLAEMRRAERLARHRELRAKRERKRRRQQAGQR